MAAPIQELNQAIQTLARSVEELKHDHAGAPNVGTNAREWDSTCFDDTLPSELEENITPDGGMLGLRWFANWRQGTSMKGVA